MYRVEFKFLSGCDVQCFLFWCPKNVKVNGFYFDFSEIEKNAPFTSHFSKVYARTIVTALFTFLKKVDPKVFFSKP
jgi:hypothetical protein